MSVPSTSRKTLVIRSLILAFVLSVPSAAPASAIQGGSTVSASSAPWLVAILSREANGDEYSCSGSVIAAKWILTAAHCVTEEADNSALSPSEIRVLGPGKSPDIAGAWERGIVPLAIYPSFLYTYTEDWYPWADIALIELDQTVPGAKILKLDAPTAKHAAGTNARAYGWGVINNSQANAGSSARTVPLKVLANSGDATCRKWTVSESYQGPSLVCAGSTNSKAAICAGDSGGPLVKSGGVPVQIGITSFSGGKACATYNLPGQFVRIATMRWWIDSIMGKSNVISQTPGEDPWLYYSWAESLWDVKAHGSSILMLASNQDGDERETTWAEKIFANSARQDFSFAAARDGIFRLNLLQDEYVQDAALLSDGRPVWSTSQTVGDSALPNLLSTPADGGDGYTEWFGGAALAQRIVGSGYTDGWTFDGRQLITTESGGALVAYEIYQGTGDSDIAVVEWDSSGQLSTSFGGDGWYRFGEAGLEESTYDLALMADGSIAVLGLEERSCAVWKILRSGQPDNTWGTNGKAQFGNRDCIARGATSDASNGLYVVGADYAATSQSNSSAFLTHLTSLGVVDKTFGVNGYVRVNTVGVDYLLDVCTTPNSRVVAVGQSSASDRRSYEGGVGSVALVVIVDQNGKRTLDNLDGETNLQLALGGQNDYFVSADCLSDNTVAVGGQSMILDYDGETVAFSLVAKMQIR